MTVLTGNAPVPIGPYSQARQHADLLFISGQLPIDPATNKIPLTSDEQMHQVLRNLKAITEAAGATMQDVIKTTILVTDLAHFQQLNEIYSTYFASPYPARTTYQVAALPMNAHVEIEAIVSLPVVSYSLC